MDVIDLPANWLEWLLPGAFFFYAMVLLMNRDTFWKVQYYWRRGKDPVRVAKINAKSMTPEMIKFRSEYYKNRRQNDPEWNQVQNRRTIEHFKVNKERYYKQHREYRAKDPEKHRAWNTQWHREKRQNDPQYRIGNRLRSRLWHALVAAGVKKAYKTEDLVGCTVAELRTHLEARFKDGMNWENIGEWHIDHIIPCVSFDLTDLEQQKKCFHWSNLQPLWGRENISKGGKVLVP